jgi:hypothetical protein
VSVTGNSSFLLLAKNLPTFKYLDLITDLRKTSARDGLIEIRDDTNCNATAARIVRRKIRPSPKVGVFLV